MILIFVILQKLFLKIIQKKKNSKKENVFSIVDINFFFCINIDFTENLTTLWLSIYKNDLKKNENLDTLDGS